MNHVKHPPNGTLSQWILDQFPPGHRGWAVDVGASDGVSINTTWALEKAHFWSVLSVEANPDFAPLLKDERAWVEMCACSDFESSLEDFNVNQDCPESFSALKISSHECVRSFHSPNPWKKAKVPVRTLNSLLAKWEYPRLDALCVDVEGGELEVLKGLDLNKWRPKAIVSEAWDAGHEYPYLAKFGYKLVGRNVHNDLYVLEGK